jgi:hypothetical protein
VPHGVVTGIIFALAPTIVVGLIFWYVMRAIIRADRVERSTYTKIEREERARFERERSAAGAEAVHTAPSAAGPDAASTPRSPGSVE